MANPDLARELASFTARIQKSKNRLVAIPAEVQRRLGLKRRRQNHIVVVSIRPHDRGRWNHHYFRLTFDNEFMVPTDIAGVAPGDAIDVKVHRVIQEATEAPRQGSKPFGAA